MRIFLLDDHPLFREGLKLLLAKLGRDIQFREAPNFAHFRREVSASAEPVDILLLDLGLPDIEGLTGLCEARALLPHTLIVVLSSEDDPQIIQAAIRAGAAGFIPKSSSNEVLIAALQLVLAGGIYLPAHALALTDTPRAPRSPQAERANLLEHLTERQRAVLELAVQGKVNKIIARELGISEATVKAHLSVCFRILGVKNRTEAVFQAAGAGSRKPVR